MSKKKEEKPSISKYLRWLDLQLPSIYTIRHHEDTAIANVHYVGGALNSLAKLFELAEQEED